MSTADSTPPPALSRALTGWAPPKVFCPARVRAANGYTVAACTGPLGHGGSVHTDTHTGHVWASGQSTPADRVATALALLGDSLTPRARRRVLDLVGEVTPATWNEARGIVLTRTGPTFTVWTATVAASDYDVTRGPSTMPGAGDPDPLWDAASLPTGDQVVAGLAWAEAARRAAA